MDKLFLQGLASGNYRKWGPTQYRRWSDLIKPTSGTIGIENEVRFERRSERDEKWKILRSNTRYKNHIDEFGKWFYDDTMGSHEFEMVALLESTKPYKLHKQLDNLVAYAESIGINMQNSTHINVVGENLEYISSSKWLLLYNYCHARTDKIIIDNGNFTMNVSSFMKRLENKSGVSSMFSEDYMFQFYAVLSLYKVALKANEIRKKVSNREDSAEMIDDIVDINTESILTMRRLLLEEDYFFSVKKEYSKFTYTKYMYNLIRKVMTSMYFSADEGDLQNFIGFLKSGNMSYHSFVSDIKSMIVLRTVSTTEHGSGEIAYRVIDKLKTKL
jgi:hypothetical protein